MDQVVTKSARLLARKITQHKQIRCEEKHGKPKPTAVQLMVKKASDEQNGCALNME